MHRANKRVTEVIHIADKHFMRYRSSIYVEDFGKILRSTHASQILKSHLW